MLDLIDEVFWMLLFNSQRQANRVRQGNNITEDAWNARRKAIRSEHRSPDARNELGRLWEIRVSAGKKAGAPEEEEDDILPIRCK
jgi:hypothetical protein